MQQNLKYQFTLHRAKATLKEGIRGQGDKENSSFPYIGTGVRKGVKNLKAVEQ